MKERGRSGRHRIHSGLVLLVLAVPPLLVQCGAGVPGLESLVALLTGVVGLALVYRVTEGLAGGVVGAWTTLTLLYGTLLFADMTGGSDALPHAASFGLAALAAALWWDSRRAVLSGRAIGAGLALIGAASIPYVVTGIPPVPSLSRLGETLFASRGGLLYWAPVLWAGALGYIPLARREGRTIAAPALGLVAILLAATTRDDPSPFIGAGRFHAALPLLGLGLGAAFGVVRSAAARRPLIPLLAGAGALVVWNVLFMEQYRTDRIPRDFVVSFPQVTETNAAILARAVGSPLAWPANWVFAWRHDLPAAKYDVVVGQSLFGEGGLDGTIVMGDERVDPALLAEGWGSRRACEGAVCRQVVGAARLLVPLESSRPFRVTVRAAGSGTLSLLVNGAPLAELPLAPALTDLRVPATPGPWRAGLNHMVLSCASPGEAWAERLVFEAEPGAR
jgi:hypothetical protein